MSQLLSRTRVRIRIALSSIQLGASARRLYASAVALLIFALLGAATRGVRLEPSRTALFDQCRTQPLDNGLTAQSTTIPTQVDTTVVFGPRQFVTVKNSTQINFAESFSVPASSTPNATEYMIRLQRVGGKLTTATVSINGASVAVTADFATATTIERFITVNQSNPNTNSLTLSLKGDAGAGIAVTIYGFPNSSFDVFGPKPYTMMALSPTCYEESFVVPADASPPYRIFATSSATATKAIIYLNDVKVLDNADFGTTAPVMRTVGLMSGTNVLRIQISGAAGTTITVRLTAKDTVKPVITITSPPPNLVTNAATVAVTGSVQARTPTTVKVNGSSATMSGAGNTQFSATIPLTEGSNAVLISATNQAGTRTDSTRTVIRDTHPPTLALTSPADGSYTNQAGATVTGTVTDATTVTVKVNGVSYPIADGGAFSGSYQLAAGANFLTAVATDKAGNTASVTNKVTLDTDAPVVSISAPAEGLITKQTSVAVSGTVTDASPTTVTVNGITAPVGTNGSFVVTVPLGTEGSNAINVVATDAATNHSTASRHVIRDTQAPVVAIASPAEGFLTNQGTVSVSGTVTDATAITLTANGVTLTVDAAGNFTGQVPLAAEGTNPISFVATDAATNQSTQSRNVLRDTQAPVVTLSSPTEGLITKQTSVQVTGTATDASATTVTVNGVNVPIGANGSFSGTVPVSEGANIIAVVATDAATNQSALSRNLVRDTQAPVVTIAAPTDGSVTNANSTSVSGTVTDATAVTLSVNGVTIPVDASGNFTGTVPLGAEGPNTITFTATDAAGNSAAPAVTVRRDSEAPVLSVTAPTDNSITRTSAISIAGNVFDASTVAVSVNGAPVIVDGTGSLSGSVTLVEGANIVTVVATDGVGNTSSQVRRVTLDTQAPVITISQPADGASIATESVVTTGSVSDASATTLTVNGASVAVATGGAFSGEVSLTTGPNTLSYVATDAAGNVGTASRTVTRQLPGPPDPIAVATPVNKAEVTLMQENTAFLYAGENPVQSGVAPGTIAFLRAAVLRGKVLDRALAPLTNVAVTIKDHPELGHTTTRSDGAYDLAVNGGGTLVLDFAKGGYLPAQRSVAVPWQDYTTVDSVILIQPDPVKTVVDLTSTEITVAQSSVQSDADGPRHATAFFEPGTQATLRHADGTTEVLTSLDIRATEFTVGANGGATMPGDLPPSSQYTYAVQVTADQQLAAGPGAVLTFSKPVPLYVENFLDFPVGTAVPAGVYDASAGLWRPRPNGVVLKITGTDAQGRALLDINGDGVADSDSLLAFNGIDPLERIKLAGTYPPGSALWRVQIIETLPHDLNWPYVILGGDAPRSTVTGPCGSQGADVLRCSLQVQTAFQSVGIVGSPFTLNYASDRTQGNVMDRQIKIQLVGDTVPSFLERVDMQIDIAGRRFEAGFIPTPNLSYTFVWDGKDAYGRTVQATQPASVRISYLYPVLYGVPAPAKQSFALPCMLTTGGCQLAADTREAIRALHRVEETLPTTLGAFDATGAGLGGFTLNVQHSYDPIGGQFYAGDGTRRVGATLPDQVTRWAGTGATSGAIVNNKPRLQAIVPDPKNMVMAPDGSLYFVDASRVRKVSPDGTVTTIAGDGGSTFDGDDQLATNAALTSPWGLALGLDGSLYVGEAGPRHAIRRIGPDGFIRKVAGDGVCGSTGDNGPADSARVCTVRGMGVGPDGSLYFAEAQTNRIRKIGPDGIIRTVAGTGAPCFFPGNLGDVAPDSVYIKQCGEGIPATRALLRSPSGLTVGPDGTVYFAQTVGGIIQGRIRRIDPAGFIYTVAGGDVKIDKLGEGGSAKQAHLEFLDFAGMVLGPDGSLYFPSFGASNSPTYWRVRRVWPDGRITTVIGGTAATTAPLGDNGPARSARIGFVDGLAVTPAGDLLVGDDGEIRLVSAPLPGLGAGQSVIASTDGRELYVFSPAGRQLLTISAITGDTVLVFSYNANRQLIAITDNQGRSTQILRASGGAVTAVIAPSGQQTGFVLDGNGNVTRLTDAVGHEIRIGYATAGLADSVTDAAGNSQTSIFNAEGQLVSSKTPLGGVTTRSVTDVGGAPQVSVSSSLGRSLLMRFQSLANGSQVETGTLPSGLQVVTTVDPDGQKVTVTPDGTVVTAVERADPRFGMQAPVTQEVTRLPSGLTRVQRSSRAITLSDPTNALSVVSQTDTFVVNGRVHIETLDRALSRLTRRTPSGRVGTEQLDVNGRVQSQSMSGYATLFNTYDSAGRLIKLAQGPRGRQYAYDSAGRLFSTTDNFGRAERYEHDAVGRLSRWVLADGNAVAFTYDANGAVRSITPPGRTAHNFLYNGANRLEEYTPPSVGSGSTTIRFEYNTDGQLARQVRADGGVLAVAYDPAGRESTVTTPRGTTTFEYDPVTENLSRVTSPGGVAVSYAYDGKLRTSTAWTGPVTGTVATTYDNDFRPSVETVNGQSGVTVQYDPDGLVASVGPLTITNNAQSGLPTGTTLGAVTTSSSFTSTAELQNFVAAFGSASLIDRSFTRDTLGRIIGLTETIGGASSVYAYGYDSAGRLHSVMRDGALEASYDYDQNGNRVQMVSPNGVMIGTYDAQDRLVSLGNFEYRYTPDGELSMKVIGADTTRYEYDVLGALTRVHRPDGTEIEYLLDGDNRRIGKKVGGILTQGFLYSGPLRIVAEVDGSNQVVARYFYGQRTNVPDYMSKGGRTYRIITDIRGSVRLVVDTETGDVAQRIDYDAFGQVKVNTAPGFQPFGFAGGLYDEQTGLTRLGARDYDAYTGRWTAKDPTLFDGGDPNLYAYASGDPVNAVDVTGETSLIELAVTRYVEENLPAVIKDGWERAEKVMASVREFEKSDVVKNGRIAEDLVNRAIDGFVESPEDDGVEAIAAAMELWQGQVANVAKEGLHAALLAVKEMFYVPKFVLNYERVNCQGVESNPFLYAESGWYNPRRGPLPQVWGDIVAACHAFGK